MAGGFGDIHFGFASAEKEGAEAPELLVGGFLDDAHLTEAAVSGSPFVFLGYKGSGKTALAEHARLIAERDPSLFVTVTTLDHFSYGDFKSIAGGSAEHQVRYATAWAWILLVALVQSLEEDAARTKAPPEYRSLVRYLHELGLMPVTDLRLLVATSSKQSFKASLPRLLEYSHERVSSSQDLQLHQIVMSLRRAVIAFPTTNRHVVFMDGLDSIVTQKDLQLQALSALMHEASALNLLFRRNDRPFKFVVLCRTDIFDRLPGANINKVRQDESVSLNWFDAPGQPESTRLMRMVNLRAQRSLGRQVDVFSEFLPPEIGDRPARQLVLDHTRHSPRDLVQLLRKLQQYSGGSHSVTVHQFRAGLRAYSIEYFLPEMRNELDGYLEPDEIDKAIVLLTSMSRPRVSFAELERIAAELELGGLDVRALVRALFEASCIGTVSEAPGRRPHYTFKYRNPMATIVPGQPMRIHPGALKALNIEPQSPGRQRRAARSRHSSWNPRG